LGVSQFLSEAGWWTYLLLLADWLIRIGLSWRVVMRRRAVGVSLSWLIVILTVPFVGAVLYLVMGENRLGSRRARSVVELHNTYAGWRSGLRDRAEIDWDKLPPPAEAIHRQAVRVSGIPALPDNTLDLIGDSQDSLRAMIDDIDRARHRCHLEFYIWHEGGVADGVTQALVRATRRGVVVRILVDAVGSKAFLNGSASVQKLREAGAEVVACLPAGLLRAAVRRLDLRNHRKLMVVDGVVAYTGSLNLIDPACFKAEAGVGQWIDAMVRIEGPAVEALAVTFLEDWQMETGRQLEPVQRRRRTEEPPGPSVDEPDARPATGLSARHAPVQVVPSGPTLNPENIHRLLVAAIYSARHSVTLTTPYFVPDEALLIALTSAAARGVDTLIIMPERIDSWLVRHASNAMLDELLSAGVKIARFTGGLLHTKSVTVDDYLTTFGTVNLDYRSFHLNFELTLIVYDRDFTRRVTSLQQSYVMNCNMETLEAWRRRPYRRRLLDNAARLLGPLL
jgi:cardiolipin synthase